MNKRDRKTIEDMAKTLGISTVTKNGTPKRLDALDAQVNKKRKYISY